MVDQVIIRPQDGSGDGRGSWKLCGLFSGSHGVYVRSSNLDVVEMARDDERLGLVKSMVEGGAKTRSRLASNA